MKAPNLPTGGFPWNLLAQAVLLVIAIVAEVMERKKK